MIGYYALLRRAVCALQANTKEHRYALYERARNALAALLRALDPAPTDSEIVDECLALDAAIHRVEAAYAILDTLTHLPPGARFALRSALDAMRQTEAPLSGSELLPALESARRTRAQQAPKLAATDIPAGRDPRPGDRQAQQLPKVA